VVFPRGITQPTHQVHKSKHPERVAMVMVAGTGHIIDINNDVSIILIGSSVIRPFGSLPLS
jgi:hypothetical protein